MLVRRRRYEAHRWLQTSGVILNAILVAVWMVCRSWLYILPGIPGSLSKPGTRWPRRTPRSGSPAWRSASSSSSAPTSSQARRERARYKTTMRVAYFVYLGGFVLGLWLYVVTYG